MDGAETLVHGLAQQEVVGRTHDRLEGQATATAAPVFWNWCEPLLLSAIAFVGYLLGANGYDLLTDDEIRYAEAGRQMLVRGDWIVPIYNGEPRFQKPLLVYWLQAASQWVFGSHATATRVPSAIAAAVTLLATWWLARTVWDRFTARWAVIVLASMLEFVLLARMVLIDMLLVAFLQVALASTVAAWARPRDKIRVWLYRLAGLALGGAVCAKGPLALLLFGFVLVPWVWFVWKRWTGSSEPCHERWASSTTGGQLPRQPQTSMQVPWVSALLLVALFGLPSYLLPHWRTGGAFTWQFLFAENWLRFTSVVNEHPQPWWFYLALLVPLTFPWTGALPGAAGLAWRTRRQLADWRGYFPFALLGHVLLVFGFFTWSRTKVWTYTFPAFPSLALLVAHWLAVMHRDYPGMLQRRLRQALGFGAAVAIAGAIGVSLWPASRLPAEVRVDEFLWAVRSWAWCLGAMLMLCWLVSWIAAHAETVLRWLLASTVVLYGLAVFYVLPSADRMWNAPVRQVAELWNRYPQAEVITYYVHELGLNFLARRDLVHHWRAEALPDLYERLRYPEPVFVLVDPQVLHHFHGLPVFSWTSNNRFIVLSNFPPEGFTPIAENLR